MRLLSAFVQGIGHLIRYASLRILMAISRPVRILEIEIRDLTQSPPSDRNIGPIADALRLVQATDTLRSHRVAKNTRRILITHAGVPEYVPAIDACLLPVRELQTQSTTHLAMTLVQQTTVATLLRHSNHRAPTARSTVEADAAEEALAFGRAAGASPEDIIAFHMRDSHSRTYADDPRRAITDFRELGVPNWLARVLGRLLRSGAARD